MRKFVVLPDGSYEEVKPLSVVDCVVPDSEYTPIEVDPFVTEAVEEGIKTPEHLDHFITCRLNGCSPKLAAALATRSFPGVKTDAVFNEGKFSGQSTGECSAHGVWLREQARLAGVSTNGKWYCSGLASFPGDPTAWVDSRGDVLRIAEAKNMTTHGYVDHQAYETDGGEDLVIDDGLIEDEVADILEANPFAAIEAVREEVYALRTGAVDNNPLLCRDYDSTDIE